MKKEEKEKSTSRQCTLHFLCDLAGVSGSFLSFSGGGGRVVWGWGGVGWSGGGIMEI